MRDQAPVVLSIGTLTGNSVRNAEGDDLGEIKDFVIDVRDGRTAYAVLDFGGFLGMGNTLFAVPYAAMRLNTVDECFVLDVDKDRLKDAPGFDKDDWPENADYSFVNRVHDFYGMDPWEPASRV